MKNFIAVFFFGISFLFGGSDVEILGLRVYGNGDEYQPPIITIDEMISIEFDVTTVHPPNLQIIFKHASKNWIEDENVFVNDPSKLRTDYLAYTVAPNGVYQYTFHYKNSFPNERNVVRFLHSGNYLFNIVDRDANDEIVASGKFIVTEELVDASMTVENRYHPESVSPYNQVNYIEVTVSASDDYKADNPSTVYHPDIKTVDIMQNWKLGNPYRIDLGDRNSDTFIDDFLKPRKVFSIRNIPTGNEYRRLDLSSTTLYPNTQLAVIKGGPDVSRFQWQGKPDANGASKLKPFVGANSDYLEVEMRLRVTEKQVKDIFVVGGFNNWEVLPEYAMGYDTITQLYLFKHWVRRGVYDYQYVLGKVNKDGIITEEDWFSLEGNDWRTINRLYALVYYNDQRYGGFDRVVGFVKGRSPGKGNGEKKDFSKSRTGKF